MTRRTKAQGKKRGSRPRANPMVPIPNRSKNTMSFDGTFLNGTLYHDASITVANLGSDFDMIGTDLNLSISRAMTGMIKFYREYRVHRCTLTWLPKVAPGVADGASQIHVAYTDNPEQMAFLFNAATTNAQRRNFCIGSKTNASFNAWERFSYNIPLTRRLPWFNVNTTMVSIVDPDEIGRSIQGTVVMGYATVATAAIILGTWKLTYSMELRGLDTDAGSTL